MRKRIAMLLCLVLMLSFAVPMASAAEAVDPNDMVILYTNDVHTYIDGPMSYDVIAGVKAELQKQYNNVLLVDAGDHIQGTAYGSMDKGATIIKLMNAAGYNLATLGNHEFDYGMEGCENVRQWADFPYVSCNFYHETAGVRGENVLDSYATFPFGDKTVAIVGITTPESFTKSTPAYFQDGNGNYIYGISGGEDGSALYADVQAAIDGARSEGADIVIALGHLGIDPASRPWTSEDTIAHVTGLDAFIDGHSHSTVEGKKVADKDGDNVLLTQTGDYFGRIGMMVIDDKTGDISTDFIEVAKTADGQDYALVSDLYTGASWCSDEAVAAIQDAWITEIDTKLGTVIGSTQLTFDNYDENGTRLVRSQETNTGDFAADALYYLFDSMGLDVDVAVMNGGGIRNKAISGDISYKTCKEIHTFGNVACLQTITGQQLLDALEWGARSAGSGEECGGFLQVSGITYKIDTKWPESTQKDEKGVWTGAPTGGYRVHDVKVYNKKTGAWDDLSLTASYNLAGYNYTLRDLGDGFNMFSGAVNVLDYVMEDYMVLANYVQAFKDGKVAASNSPLAAKYPGFTVDYSTVRGSGRIVLEADEPDKDDASCDGGVNCVSRKFKDVNTKAWYHPYVDFVVERNLMRGMEEDQFGPNVNLSRAMLVTILYRYENEPAVTGKMPFTDVSSKQYYYNAVLWAAEHGIVNGVSKTTFAPEAKITREQMVAILYRYAKYKGVDVSAQGDIGSFPDNGRVSGYAKAPFAWTVSAGIIVGDNGKLMPKANATRAEVAAVLQRYIVNIIEN